MCIGAAVEFVGFCLFWYFFIQDSSPTRGGRKEKPVERVAPTDFEIEANGDSDSRKQMKGVLLGWFVGLLSQ
jgi:hypothetical protein